MDDERLARRELRRLLAEHPGIRIVGEAGNAAEAREALAELSPDLLFLDVQMPGETGFDLLASLDAVPAVVFTTAYDEYALRAFEVSALDYLVKPIEPERLARTVERLLQEASRVPGAADPSIQPSNASDPAPDGGTLGPHHRVFLKDGDRCWFVELGRIRLFESEDNYTRVHFDDEKPLILRSLSELEAKLDPASFFRANRSQIVGLQHIHSVHPWFGDRLMLEVRGGHEVVLSRRRAQEFRQRMSV